ncbi:MAG TPA: DUF4440 domain-containing protein [Longimicrobium sp.]|jgi:hypothetical protein
MRSSASRALALLLLIASTACTPPARGSSGPSGAGVEAEARAFMDAYARDLLAGNRAAIAARYDRRGAYFMGNGQKDFQPYEAIVARYGGPRWNPPATFEWRDLSFEPAGPDAVLVAGRFTWGRQGRAPMTLSYTGFLHRQDGVLRIRLEDESFDPRDMPPPAQRDTTGG